MGSKEAGGGSGSRRVAGRGYGREGRERGGGPTLLPRRGLRYEKQKPVQWRSEGSERPVGCWPRPDPVAVAAIPFCRPSETRGAAAGQDKQQQEQWLGGDKGKGAGRWGMVMGGGGKEGTWGSGSGTKEGWGRDDKDKRGGNDLGEGGAGYKDMDNWVMVIKGRWRRKDVMEQRQVRETGMWRVGGAGDMEEGQEATGNKDRWGRGGEDGSSDKWPTKSGRQAGVTRPVL